MCSFTGGYSIVRGFNHIEKYEFVNGKDYPIYEMENKIHVPNHQPVIIVACLWLIVVPLGSKIGL